MTCKQIQIVGLLVFCLFLPACNSQRKQAVVALTPEAPYICHQATGPITLDGILNEPAWQQAQVIDRFYLFAPKDAMNPSATSVRMLHDDDTLYVAFECEDDDVWSFTSEPDGDLWNGDVVEVFIKPDKDKLSYAEFVVSPNGVLFDAWHASRGGGGAKRFRGWSSGAKAASSVTGTDGRWDDNDTGFRVELAIPLGAITDAVGQIDTRGWTFGAFRYDYSKSRDQPLLLMSLTESLKRGFHYYEGYRELRLSWP